MELTKELIKIFADWTKIKVRVHISEKEIYPKHKEIWWVNMGQNIGCEINGKNKSFERPILVLKVFSRFVYLIAPISSKIREDQYLIKFMNMKNETNTINLSQIRTISNKRFIRKIGQLEADTFNKVINKIKDFL